MKLSKQYIKEQLQSKTANELALEIVTEQLADYKTPTGYSVDFDATVAKYTKMIENVA